MVPAVLYLEHFASDRSHMWNQDGVPGWSKPVPPYPAIAARGGGSTYALILDMLSRCRWLVPTALHLVLVAIIDVGGLQMNERFHSPQSQRFSTVAACGCLILDMPCRPSDLQCTER